MLLGSFNKKVLFYGTNVDVKKQIENHLLKYGCEENIIYSTGDDLPFKIEGAIIN